MLHAAGTGIILMLRDGPQLGIKWPLCEGIERMSLLHRLSMRNELDLLY